MPLESRVEIDGEVSSISEIKSIEGEVDTDSYPHGDSGDEDGSAFPYTIDPESTIRELAFPVVGDEFVVEIETTGGDVFAATVGGLTAIDTFAIERAELQDPNGTAPRVAWWWAGE